MACLRLGAVRLAKSMICRGGSENACLGMGVNYSRSSVSGPQHAGRVQIRGTLMSSIAAYGTLSAADHGRQMRKAVVAATVGTTIEWYDFFLYGTAAGLVFGKLYFPNNDPTTATLLAFSTYFVGFAARPIGAAIFG